MSAIPRYTYDDIMAGSWKYRLTEFVDAVDHVAAMQAIVPHAFNYHTEFLNTPHDHMCACNMDDEPICNRSCIYCSCWRIEAARKQALDKALEALNEMPELGGGLAPFVRRHAALQVIYALKKNSDE